MTCESVTIDLSAHLVCGCGHFVSVSYSGVRQSQCKARGLALADIHYAKLAKVGNTDHFSDALMRRKKGLVVVDTSLPLIREGL